MDNHLDHHTFVVVFQKFHGKTVLSVHLDHEINDIQKLYTWNISICFGHHRCLQQRPSYVDTVCEIPGLVNVNKKRTGKSPCLMGKSSITGHFQ